VTRLGERHAGVAGRREAKRYLTLRDNTVRPETVTVGTNELIGTDPANLYPVLARLMAGR